MMNDHCLRDAATLKTQLTIGVGQDIIYFSNIRSKKTLSLIS